VTGHFNPFGLLRLWGNFINEVELLGIVIRALVNTFVHVLSIVNVRLLMVIIWVEC